MRPIWILACATLLGAQNPADLLRKAPPAVEEALRARVQQFYQFHVEGKFRQAEALVAEESKDDFYSSNKPRCLKFEVPTVEFSDEFTKAKATVVCHMYVNMMGFMQKPVPVPLPSHWKLVAGQWFWYAPPVSNVTPFGNMKPGGGDTTGAGILPGTLPKGDELQALLNQVKADRSSVQFKNSEGGAAEVTITSAMPGKVRLSLRMPRNSRLEARLDREELDRDGRAVLSIKAAPSKAARASQVITVEVSPTGHAIPIKVVFIQ